VVRGPLLVSKGGGRMAARGKRGGFRGCCGRVIHGGEKCSWVGVSQVPAFIPSLSGLSPEKERGGKEKGEGVARRVQSLLRS